MTFAELDHGARLGTNFFGISEPDAAKRIDPRRLDLVLTPLVAFDDRGVRIGVGRGYYDRCFRFLHARGAWHRPKLLGVAYELQHVRAIAPEPWDVPLWGAVTEVRVRRFERGT
jgi:5-formyltetrahydrofolate cyclo-ligase